MGNIMFTRPAGRYYRFRTVLKVDAVGGGQIEFRLSPKDGSAFKILHLQTGPDDYTGGETIIGVVRNEDGDIIAFLIYDTATDNIQHTAILEQVGDGTNVISVGGLRLGFSSKESLIGHSDYLQIKSNTSLVQNETLTVEVQLRIFGEIPERTIVSADTSKIDDYEYTY